MHVFYGSRLCIIYIFHLFHRFCFQPYMRSLSLFALITAMKWNEAQKNEWNRVRIYRLTQFVAVHQCITHSTIFNGIFHYSKYNVYKTLWLICISFQICIFFSLCTEIVWIHSICIICTRSIVVSNCAFSGYRAKYYKKNSNTLD